MSARSTVVTNIGLLVTNRLEHESADELTNAWLVFEGEHVTEVGTGAVPAADRVIDAGGGCVVPGFVDSHTHLVFAGDRSEEFVRRMAGEPYQAGGIRSTVDATRQASTPTLTALASERTAEARRAGITTIEIKSGYGLSVDEESRQVEIAETLTDEVTFLGAHVVPDGYEADDYVDLVTGPMLEATARHSKWIDVFCEEGAFDADQSRAVLEAGREAGLGLRIHANQLNHGPGVQLAVDLDCASADHCTFLSDTDVEALAASNTVATFLPAAEFSTKQPYPDASRVLNAGGNVAIATNCNPGSSYTTSMAFCIALAVRDMGLTAPQALRAATLGGAKALRRDDVGVLHMGSRADLIILDAPSYTYLVYRPGVPLIADVLVGGISELA